MNKSLNQNAVRKYHELQEQSARILVDLLLKSPQDFLKHIRNTVGRSIVNISYGRDVMVNDQDYIDYAEYVHDVFGLAARPFAFLVDHLPFRESSGICTSACKISYLPGSSQISALLGPRGSLPKAGPTVATRVR